MDKAEFEEKLKERALALESGDGDAYRLQREVSDDGGVHIWAGEREREVYYDNDLFLALINLVYGAGWLTGKHHYFTQLAQGKPANISDR